VCAEVCAAGPGQQSSTQLGTTTHLHHVQVPALCCHVQGRALQQLVALLCHHQRGQALALPQLLLHLLKRLDGPRFSRMVRAARREQEGQVVPEGLAVMNLLLRRHGAAVAAEPV
jgi:hypothetical protein